MNLIEALLKVAAIAVMVAVAAVLLVMAAWVATAVADVWLDLPGVVSGGAPAGD